MSKNMLDGGQVIVEPARISALTAITSVRIGMNASSKRRARMLSASFRLPAMAAGLPLPLDMLDPPNLALSYYSDWLKKPLGQSIKFILCSTNIAHPPRASATAAQSVVPRF